MAYVPARRPYHGLGYLDVALGPWIESWAWIDRDGHRMADFEVSESYFLKSLDYVSMVVCGGARRGHFCGRWMVRDCGSG